MAKNNEFDAIIHGCNCFNMMGGGIANQIRHAFPEAFRVDLNTVKGEYNKLGNYSFAKSNGVLVFNVYTQYGISRGDDVFEYDAFSLVLQKLAFKYHGLRWGLPLIGCGLAGGDMTRILEIIKVFSDNVDKHSGSVTVVEWDNEKK